MIIFKIVIVYILVPTYVIKVKSATEYETYEWKVR